MRNNKITILQARLIRRYNFNLARILSITMFLSVVYFSTMFIFLLGEQI